MLRCGRCCCEGFSSPSDAIDCRKSGRGRRLTSCFWGGDGRGGVPISPSLHVQHEPRGTAAAAENHPGAGGKTSSARTHARTHVGRAHRRCPRRCLLFWVCAKIDMGVFEFAARAEADPPRPPRGGMAGMHRPMKGLGPSLYGPGRHQPGSDRVWAHLGPAVRLLVEAAVDGVALHPPLPVLVLVGPAETQRPAHKCTAIAVHGAGGRGVLFGFWSSIALPPSRLYLSIHRKM